MSCFIKILSILLCAFLVIGIVVSLTDKSDSDSIDDDYYYWEDK